MTSPEICNELLPPTPSRPCQWPADRCPLHALPAFVPGTPIPFPEEPDFQRFFRRDRQGLRDPRGFALAVLEAMQLGQIDPVYAVRYLSETVYADQKLGLKTDYETAGNVAIASGFMIHGLPWSTEAIWEVAVNCWEPTTLFHQGLRSPRRFRRPIPGGVDLRWLRNSYEKYGRPNLDAWPEDCREQWLADYPGYPDSDTLWAELEAEFAAKHQHPSS